MESTAVERPQIAFFDVETTVPTRSSGGYALLEFGAIVVCPSRLVELGSYSTLIRPADLDAISALSVRCNGITKDTVANAPHFRDVADVIYGILNGRVWAGHNIARFDCVRIREAFAELGRPAPEPKGLIDTLPLLTQRFGRRAGDMKMASLATYFGLGHQKHRSLDDVRMNLEVVKYCATILFLEASLPDMFSVLNSEQNTTIRIEGNKNASPDGIQTEITPCNLIGSQKRSIPMESNQLMEVSRQDISTVLESKGDDSTLVAHMEHMKIDSVQRDTTVFTCSTFKSDAMLCTSDASCSGYAGFLEPDELSPQQITAPVFCHHYGQKITLLHRNCPLQICSMGMTVHFGVSTKYTDHAGRPKLSIVVNISDSLLKTLDVCDQLAQRTSQSCGSSLEWRPLIRRNGYSDPSIRLQIPIVENGDVVLYSTEMYQKDPSGNVQKLVFSKIDIEELESLFTPGVMVDAYFGLDIYDFQQNAGIRLVAKRLVLHARQ